MKATLLTLLGASVVLAVFLSIDSAAASKNILVLSNKNTINLNMPIFGESAKTVQLALLEKSSKLPASAPLYLFLNSPGGSIDDGRRIIEVAHGIPQKVHTVSLFSASMSFIISQYLNTRYITETGVMMSHRASGGGLEGQIPGNLITRTLFSLAQIVAIDAYIAGRAQMPVKHYQDLIANELWMEAAQAENLKFADKTVAVRCDASLRGPADPIKIVLMGLFKVSITFHKCPLITEPLSIEADELTTSKGHETLEMLFHDKARFAREYIKTNRLQEILR